MRALDVANAALMEVGLPPTARRMPNGTKRIAGPRAMTRRAVALGLIAESGPDALMTCLACIPLANAAGASTNCVTAGDVLRGRTCSKGDQP